MEEVINFLNNNRSGMLATVEENLPKVRPWGFMFEDKGKFWFLTSNGKRVFKQMQENPNIEFCSCSKEGSHIRLSGKAVFEHNLEIKGRMFEIFPMLKNIYETPDNPVLEAFYIEHGTAFISYFNSEKTVFIEF